MKNLSAILRKIEAQPAPRHLFVVPLWADSFVLDRLLREGYLTCAYEQRDERGNLLMLMGLQLTPKGEKLLRPQSAWSLIALRGTLAGVSLATMSTVILYLA